MVFIMLEFGLEISLEALEHIKAFLKPAGHVSSSLLLDWFDTPWKGVFLA